MVFMFKDRGSSYRSFNSIIKAQLKHNMIQLVEASTREGCVDYSFLEYKDETAAKRDMNRFFKSAQEYFHKASGLAQAEKQIGFAVGTEYTPEGEEDMYEEEYEY